MDMKAIHVHRLRLPIAIAVLSAVYLVFGLANTWSPWMYGHHGYCGANRSIAARNFVRYGPMGTRLAASLDLGEEKTEAGGPRNFKPYWHHPQGPSMLLAAVFAVAGESAAAARLLALSFSILTLALLFLLWRGAAGPGQAVLALAMLAFVPMYAANLNFVNFEIFATTVMVAVLAAYQSHARAPTVWKGALLCLLALAGAFTDFSVYPFLFFFWVHLAWRERGRGRAGLALILVFPACVLLGLAAWLAATAFAMKLGPAGFFEHVWRLAFVSSSARSRWTHLDVLRHWNYYLDALGPVPIVLFVLWIGLAAVRGVRTRALSLADAWIGILFLTALVYWLALPERAWVHEYFVYYFCIPMALASASALHDATGRLLPRPAVRAAVRVAVVLLAAALSLPAIWSARVFPAYQFSTPPHRIRNPRQYDYCVTLDHVAAWVRDHTRPDERIAVMASSRDLRMDFGWALDREFRVFKTVDQVEQAMKRHGYAFVIVDTEATQPGRFKTWITHRRFVVLDRYMAFDMGGRLKSHVVLRRRYARLGPMSTIVTSLARPAHRVVRDRWAALDLTLKLSGRKQAEAMRKHWKKRPGKALTERVARYNLDRAAGRKPSFKGVSERLTHRRKSLVRKDIEHLGSRIKRQAGGRMRLEMVFRAAKRLDRDFQVRLQALPTHRDADLLEGIGTQIRTVAFPIPTSQWQPGLLYLASRELDLFQGPYGLAFDLVPEGQTAGRPGKAASLVNLGTGSYGNRFPFSWIYRYDTID